MMSQGHIIKSRLNNKQVLGLEFIIYVTRLLCSVMKDEPNPTGRAKFVKAKWALQGRLVGGEVSK